MHSVTRPPQLAPSPILTTVPRRVFQCARDAWPRVVFAHRARDTHSCRGRVVTRDLSSVEEDGGDGDVSSKEAQ